MASLQWGKAGSRETIWEATVIIQERDGVAWTRMVLVEVLRSSGILDIF